MSTLTAALAATQQPVVPVPARSLYRLPIEPLEHAVSLRGGISELGASRALDDSEEHQRWVERTMRSWSRARQQGWVSVWAADELCVHLLGVHPAFIFGDIWWDTLTQIDEWREKPRRAS